MRANLADAAKGQDRGSVLRCSFTTAFGFRAEHDRLHVLINNAGVNLTHRSVSGDGFETTFAVNHLGPFLLTNLLLDLLRHSAPSRVVTVTSSAFRRGRINFDALRPSGASPASAPSRSKLTNVLFTKELAGRLEATGVTGNCVHPGVVRGTGPRYVPPQPRRYLLARSVATRLLLDRA